MTVPATASAAPSKVNDEIGPQLTPTASWGMPNVPDATQKGDASLPHPGSQRTASPMRSDPRPPRKPFAG